MEYQSEGIKAYQGDCLVESDRIGDGVVDLILTDLPYGTMKGLDAESIKGNNQKGYVAGGGYKKGYSWDTAIPPEKIYELANRILRKNGKMVLFSQEPYTSRMTVSAIPNIPFSYRMMWEKNDFANCLLSKKAPVSYYEDILVFSKNHNKHDFKGLHPLRGYMYSIRKYIGGSTKDINMKMGNVMSSHYFTKGAQFSIPNLRDYKKMIEFWGIDKMDGFRTFADLKAVDDKFRADLLHKMNTQHPSTFNLWEGKKYKSNILKYKKDYDGHHPTQKPVLLLEDLIKTFSNTGDLVVDLTAGSMSTGVACQNTGRKCTMIEMSDKYFKTGVKRLKENEHRIKTSLF